MPLNFEQTVKTIGAIVLTVSTIVSTALYVDSRYAHAGEVFQLKKDVSVNALEFRNRSLGDEIFRLDIQMESDPNNAVYPALKNRYKQELRQNNNQIQNIVRQTK